MLRVGLFTDKDREEERTFVFLFSFSFSIFELQLSLPPSPFTVAPRAMVGCGAGGSVRGTVCGTFEALRVDPCSWILYNDHACLNCSA